MTQRVAAEQEAGDLVSVELERVLAHATLQDVGLLGGGGESLSGRKPWARGQRGPGGQGHESAQLLHGASQMSPLSSIIQQNLTLSIYVVYDVLFILYKFCTATVTSPSQLTISAAVSTVTVYPPL